MQVHRDRLLGPYLRFWQLQKIHAVPSQMREVSIISSEAALASIITPAAMPSMAKLVLQVRPNFECMQTSLGGYRRKAWLLNLISVLTEPALRFQFPASYSPATPSISSTFSESNKMSHCRSLHLLSSSLSILLLRFALVNHGIHIASWWPLQRYAISPFTPSVRISNHWFSSFLISIRQFPGSWGWRRRSPSPRFLVLSQSPIS